MTKNKLIPVLQLILAIVVVELVAFAPHFWPVTSPANTPCSTRRPCPRPAQYSGLSGLCSTCSWASPFFWFYGPIRTTGSSVPLQGLFVHPAAPQLFVEYPLFRRQAPSGWRPLSSCFWTRQLSLHCLV